MSLVSVLKGRGKSGFGYGSTAEEVTSGLDLTGKRYLLTGCNSGLGQEAMRVLISRGAHVVGTARTLEKAERACQPLGERALPLACELSEPESVRRCARDVVQQGVPLAGIIANAGIMAVPELTVKHGLELHFLTNHMGHFILITDLVGQLAPQGRVTVLSSSAHKSAPKAGIEFDNLDGHRGYSPWTAYAQSKLANLLFIKALARRLPGLEQTANAVHPGVVNTRLQRSMSSALVATMKVMGPLGFKTTSEGAATEVYVATHPDVAKVKGEYFSDCNVSKSSALSRDRSLADRLWGISQELADKLT